MKEKDKYIVFSIVLFVEILALMIFISCEGDMSIRNILWFLLLNVVISIVLFFILGGANFVINKFCNYTGETVYLSKEDLHYKYKFESAREIYIDKDVANIPYKYFSDFENLQCVVFEGGNTTISENAFEGCTKLERVYLPEKLQEIKDETFKNCEKLEKLRIPKSVTKIGAGVFNGCKNLTKFDVESGNPSYLPSNNGRTLCDRAKTELLAYPSATEEVKICEKIESIGRYAFFNCKNLTSLEIPDSVTKVSGSAFIGCKKLETLVIGDGLTSLDSLPITPALESITIGNNVTEIRAGAFKDCKKLKSVTIPDNVTRIGTGAFTGCSSLTSVTIGSGVKEVGVRAFKNCKNLRSVTIPDNVTRIGKEAFKDCTNLTSVTIGNGVKEIEKNTFSGCKKLETLIIGDGLTSLDNLPITKALKSITIGSGVTKIGAGVFAGCSSLTNLRVDTNNPNYSSSDDGKILYNKDKTELLAYPSATGNVTIPAGVTRIGKEAFKDCTNLISVTIGSEVKEIGMEAFQDCKKLKSVTFADTNNWYYTSNNDYTGGKKVNDISDLKNKLKEGKYYLYKKEAENEKSN